MTAAPSDLAKQGAELLEEHSRKDLLRFLTCGSVDDGKSTLIGRLLADCKRIYEDQLADLQRDSAKHGTTGGIDYALLLDGLKAEREQGITIDVAYRYFSTTRRSFIIADTPGHEQYTRNMATGASTCNLAVILVDARKGILTQTRRHTFIASLLGIRHLVVAVNKMDAVGWDQGVFDRIRQEFLDYAARLQVQDVHLIPVSALTGANVVKLATDVMPWYQGSPLLNYLETVHIAADTNFVDMRFPVQSALRPSHDFRGFSGTVASGIIREGDEIVALPGGKWSRVTGVIGPDGPLKVAYPPMTVTVTLADEVDISRGDLIAHPGNRPAMTREIEAMVVWMGNAPLKPGRVYWLKQGPRTVVAHVAEIRYRIDVNTLHRQPGETLALNEIGRVHIRTAKPVFADPYDRNRAMGSFILMDRDTSITVAGGMVVDRRGDTVRPDATAAVVTGAERAGRLGHGPVVAAIPADSSDATASAVERRLFDLGLFAVVVDGSRPDAAARASALLDAGMVVVFKGAPPAGLSGSPVISMPHPAPDSEQLDAFADSVSQAASGSSA